MNRNQIIEEIQEKDFPELLDIWKSIFKNEIQLQKMKELYNKAKKNDNIHILGYFIENKIVGTVTLYILDLPSGREAMIWDVAVIEENRGQGIATKLMQYTEILATEISDVKRIWLFSGLHRKEAHKLYQKLGYDENRDKAFVKELE